MKPIFPNIDCIEDYKNRSFIFDFFTSVNIKYNYAF